MLTVAHETMNLALKLRGACRAARILSGGRPDFSGGLVLAYHDVGSDPSIATDYYVSPALLLRHLEMAKSADLKFVRLDELTDRLVQGLSVDAMVSVVFDDALAGVHHHALPILAERGIPATVFVVTQCLGDTPPWWDGAGRTMTPSELAECAEGGMSVAAHSRHHPSLPSLSAGQCWDEVSGSKRELEEISDRAISLFAYPLGHHDARVRSIVERAGFQAAYTFLNGRVQPGLDLMRLPRLTMSSRQRPLRFAYQLARPPASWSDHQRDDVGADI